MGTRALLASAFVGVQVGAAIVATRFVVDQVGPISLALLRYTIGLLCLLPAAVFLSRTRFARRDVLPIAALGIVQFGVLIALLNFGLQTVPSARAALIFSSFPLLTILVAAALGRERLQVQTVAGVVLTIAGVALTMAEKISWSSSASSIGEVAVLLAALCGAACSVLYRPYLQRYPTVAVSAFAMLASVIFLAPLAAGEGLFHSGLHFTLAGWGAVVFIGGSSGIGYFVWLWALRHAKASSVTAFLSLSPMTAMLLGALWLHEQIGVYDVAGLCAVAAGLCIVGARKDFAMTSGAGTRV
ncbi:MAG: DMT family transporter [Vulcanimicrobiaceae bacterium]